MYHPLLQSILISKAYKRGGEKLRTPKLSCAAVFDRESGSVIDILGMAVFHPINDQWISSDNSGNHPGPASLFPSLPAINRKNNLDPEQQISEQTDCRLSQVTRTPQPQPQRDVANYAMSLFEYITTEQPNTGKTSIPGTRYT